MSKKGDRIQIKILMLLCWLLAAGCWENVTKCVLCLLFLFVEHLKEITATFYKLDGVSRFQVLGSRSVANEAYASCPDK